MKAQYETIPTQEFNSFKVFYQEQKKFDHPLHYHPEYELTYIISSHGVRYVGNTMANFSDEEVVLLGPNLPHCWKNTEDQQYSASAISIHWKEDFLGKGWMKNREFEAICRLLQLANKGLKFHKAMVLKLKKEFYRLLELSPFEKVLSLLRILHELAHASQFHILCEEGIAYNLDYINNERINVVFQYIKNFYFKKITLHDIAVQVNLSEGYFSRFFSKAMKKTFSDFLNEYRINIACKFLIETDMPVTEVCYAAGYESIPFFYRQFKKFKNYTPLTYRLNYQKVCWKEIK